MVKKALLTLLLMNFSCSLFAMRVEQTEESICAACHEAIATNLPANDPQAIMRGNQLFDPCSYEHMFHAHCITEWLRAHTGNASCPVCRAQLRLQLPTTIPDGVRVASIFYLADAIETAAHGDYTILSRAIAAGADKRQLLIIAISVSETHVAHWLIAHGADVNETLLLAIQLRRLSIVKNLIYSFDADVHAHDEGAIQLVAHAWLDPRSRKIICLLCDAGGTQTMFRFCRLTFGRFVHSSTGMVVIGAGAVATGIWAITKLKKLFQSH